MSWTSLVPYKLLRGQININYISALIRDVEIRLSREILNDAQWRVGDRIDVMPGNGPSSGKVRIEKNARGWKMHSPGGKIGNDGGMIRISRKLASQFFPSFPGDLKRSYFEPTVVSGGIEFQLPWIKHRDSKRPFASDNLKFKPNGAGRIAAAETYVGTQNTLGD